MRRLVGLVVLAATLVVVPTPAHADEVPSTSSTVTLITGDVAQVSTYPDGRQAVNLRPGPATGHGTFQTVQFGTHTYVYPDQVLPYVRNGLLDERLFDVTTLAAQGYGDLPLILEYEGDVTAARAHLAQPVPAGATRLRDLPSVGAVAVRVPAAKAATFWEAVDQDGPAAATLDRHLRRIRLDAKVTASLDVSVPKIGAPAAWQAGYDGTGVTVAVLDTGIDATHPDFAGRIVEAKNFSTAADAVDHNGHGTHVASTVAGSGAASGGRYKGVAPGAGLLIGKVLDDSGSGSESAVIAGMEWAAARARVVSMSLGGPPTDGTDPLSQAVNRLSAQYGTLFVIAAGNSGPAANTVASPGAADAALTVGASTKTDDMASFSGRGPRVGNRAVKPELVAPGANIVAARAAGTFPGLPPTDRYVGLSGTSMATPHVAGAAAILAGQHKDWTGDRIKAALTASTTPLAAGTVFDQGSGRLDVARAVAQRVTASTGTLSFGRFLGPYGSVPAARRTVTYRNDGAADVTLDLATPVTGAAVTVAPATLTVPAGGSAEATVTLDPNPGALGLYSGRLTATGRDGSTRLVAAIGFEKELLKSLTLTPTARDGRAGPARVMIWNVDSLNPQFLTTTGAPLKLLVRPGQYLIFAAVSTMDASGTGEVEATAIVKPQLDVTADTEVALDARGAKPVDIRTPKPTEQTYAVHSVYRAVDGRALTTYLSTPGKLFVQPSEGATRGTYEYYARTDLRAPVLTMKIAGPDVTLHPVYLTPDNQDPKRFDGHRKLPAVFVGAGRPDDYEGRDVRGKVVLVRRTAGLTIENQVAAAAAAKAALVAVIADAPGVFRPAVNPAVALPTVGLTQAEGADLLRRLGQGAVSLDLTGIAYSPYRYEVVLPYAKIPDGITHVADATTTALQHTRVHAVLPAGRGAYADTVLRPYTTIATALVYMRPVPFEQDRYYTANDTKYGEQIWAAFPGEQLANPGAGFTAGAETTKTFYKGVLRPGSSTLRAAPSRTGDRFLFTYDSFVDAEPDHTVGGQGLNTAARVYRDGQLVAENPYAVGYFDVGVAQPATYRVELDVSQGRPNWRVSTEAYSAWTFRSSRPAGTETVPVPSLTAGWDLDLDLDNAAPAGKTFPLRLTAATQRGAPPVPVTGAKVWVSYDDGGTWKAAALTGAGGSYTATVRHPARRDTTGFVSLRYEVTDSDGGMLEQTVIRAYALK